MREVNRTMSQGIFRKCHFILGLLFFIICKGILGYGFDTLYGHVWESFVFFSYASLILQFALYYFLGFWVAGFFRDLEVADGNGEKQSHKKFFYGALIFIWVLPVLYYGYTWFFGFFPSWYVSWGSVIVICSGMAGRLLMKRIKKS